MTTLASLSLSDLASVSGGQLAPGYGYDPALAQQQGIDPNMVAAQQGYGYGAQMMGAPMGADGGVLGSALGSLVQTAATGFGYSFGSQLGMIAAQLVGGLIAGA